MGKRRKEAADMEFSRLLWKPRKRNAAAFFRRGIVNIKHYALKVYSPESVFL